MPIEAIAAVCLAVVIFAAGVGWREAVRWVRGELAFSRAVRGQLDEFADRWRAATGVPWGPVGNVPDHMSSPSWARDLPDPPDPGEYQPVPSGEESLPDDEDAYPRDEQWMQAGAWRRETVRGDGNQAAWPEHLVEAAQASGVRQAARRGGGRHSMVVANADTVRLNPAAVERATGGVS